MPDGISFFFHNTIGLIDTVDGPRPCIKPRLQDARRHAALPPHKHQSVSIQAE